MHGDLIDTAVADLIQDICQGNQMAQLTLDHSDQQATLFFEDGNIAHAILGNKMGEEVVYQILEWKDGNYDLQSGIKPPKITITRNWLILLLEEARLFDESKANVDSFIHVDNQQETIEMSTLEEILKEMSREIIGYIACALVGIDGINIASHTSDVGADPDEISAQMTMLLKLVDTSTAKLGAGDVEDNLTTTENAYILMRFLPDKQYYLGLATHRNTGNLGNMRLISRTYADRLSKAMPQ